MQRLVCGARDEDARSVGFDEGHKPSDWVERLVADGIEVVVDVERSAATKVLTDYASQGGSIYNGGEAAGA
ncbi:MAG: hypothetical protein R2710_01135 [Acidimicrobiales bacterium]